MAHHPLRTPLVSTLFLALFVGHAQSQTAPMDGAVERCEHSLGTLAVAELHPSSQTYLISSYRLGSPQIMLRMMAQESGCFTVLERGVGMQTIRQERAYAREGLLQEQSNLGQGQMQVADFVLTPAIQISDAGSGLEGSIHGLLGRLPGFAMINSVVGGLKFREAETSLLLADVRSGIQVANAEGAASKLDFNLKGWGWGQLGWASAGGYTKTPEGKVIAASLLDNFNRIVLTIRDKPSLIQTTSTASQTNAAESLPAKDKGLTRQTATH